jgi:hypothetical protein
MVAAVCHDVGHIGRNNAFLVETSHELAMLYNDHAPLENMHATKLFEIASQEQCAIFAHLEPQMYKDVRHLCIEAILATDNSKHAQMMSELHVLSDQHLSALNEALVKEAALKTGEWPSLATCDLLRSQEMRKVLRPLYLHLCDLSTPLKSWNLCKLWAEAYVEEMLMQGDFEKQLAIPVQILNDRSKVSVPYGQIVFIEFYIAPLVLQTTMICPPLAFAEERMLQNVDNWFKEWVEPTQTSSAKPSEEDKLRMNERIMKLREKGIGHLVDSLEDAIDPLARLTSKQKMRATQKQQKRAIPSKRSK